MKKLICLVLILSIFCPVTKATGAEIPKFKTVYQTVYDGQNSAPITNVLTFRFNLRIDYVGISAKLDGSEENIDKIKISNGTQLEIHLKQPLLNEKSYTLELFGVKEIYSSQTLDNNVFSFKTAGNVELLEEKTDNSAKTYYSHVKNYSSQSLEITFVVFAKEKRGDKLLGVKVIRENAAENGGEVKISYTFSEIKQDCDISGIVFYDINEFVPLGN